MGRPKNKPDFDPDKVINEILEVVIAAYENLDAVQRTGGVLAYGALKELSDELNLKPSKVKKLLITASVKFNKEIFATDTCKLVLKLSKEGKTLQEIMYATGLKRSAVLGYMPYTKTIYKADELSTDAERIRLFRERQKRCSQFVPCIQELPDEKWNNYLWETIEYLQGCIFKISGRGKESGQRFKYKIRGGEMFIDREEKSIMKSTVFEAFHVVLDIQKNNGCVAEPRILGINYDNYLYPIFLRLGICTQAKSIQNQDFT